MSPAIDAVIFDLGNVLIFHDNALLFRRLGGRAGLSEDAVGRRLLGDPLWQEANLGRLDGEGIRWNVCRALGIELPAPEFRALWSCHFTLNEPMLRLAESLVGRVKLLALSNTNVLHAEHFRPRLPVLERFEHVLLSNEVGLVKPDPAFFRAALERAAVPPERAAFFDDLAEYVRAAQALGIHGRMFRDAEQCAADLRALGVRA